jgi:molecular chaperone DnaK
VRAPPARPCAASSPSRSAARSGSRSTSRAGRIEDLADGAYRIILGDALATALAAHVGDDLVLIAPKGDATPAGIEPRMRRFHVAGIFHSGMYEFDRALALVNLHDAARVYQLGDRVSGLRLALRDPFMAPRVVRNLAVSLEVEISREEYEAMIRPLVESTLDSVSKALQDSGKKPGDMDAILLVGGSTRTPLVSSMLIENTGLEPRQDVHPDLAVALGAGVLASRLAGRAVERVLVDVSPFSFGVSYLGERGGYPYAHCYKPIIRRNTPLPLTRSEQYMTSHPYQTQVDVQVYQGDDEDALKNILVGDFSIEGLTAMEDANEILCRMRLDLDGILEVAAVEKRTGKSKHIRIENALRAKSAEEIAAGRKRIQELYETRGEMAGDEWDTTDDVEEEGLDEDEAPEVDAEVIETPALARAGGDIEIDALLERSRKLLAKMHGEDREEAIDLHQKIDTAMKTGDVVAVKAAADELKELLFFVEGRN